MFNGTQSGLYTYTNIYGFTHIGIYTTYTNGNTTLSGSGIIPPPGIKLPDPGDGDYQPVPPRGVGNPLPTSIPSQNGTPFPNGGFQQVTPGGTNIMPGTPDQPGLPGKSPGGVNYNPGQNPSVTVGPDPKPKKNTAPAPRRKG
jgi:hypothetical protein